ncbi:hypothetical protein N7526_007172 [Penicillium atrosanguineum]|nr:hypothetical protein N7526_007172 [Penicillium atrosanguineum]
MARMTVGIVQGRWSVLLVLTLMATIHTSHAFGSFELLPRSSDSCPTSYDSCGGNLPSDFCCSSSSTCISLRRCHFRHLLPIRSKLLPTCGEACCPFGYTCQGNSTCALDKATSSTGTSTPTTTTSSTSTDTLSTIDTATTGVTFTSVPSSSASASKETTNSATLASSCPSFPSKAVAAGFFPGAIFGAVLVLIITTCFRRRAKKKEQQEMPWEPKLKAWSQRSSTGGVIGISRPILSEDYGRSDFLLHPSPARRSYLSSRSTKSRLHRTGSRVRSLFSNGAPRLDKDAPPVPPCPITPPQQRQPSTESIKIYSPPGAFAQSRKFLGPEPYPLTLARPDTTFTDLMQVVGFNDPKGNPTYKVTVEEEKEEKERTQSKRS